MPESTESTVARHYGREGLKAGVLAAIAESGLDPERLGPADLGPVDEFHMGGRAATAEIVGRLGLDPGARVLDIGCGIGGLVRYLASEVGARATGVDLTPEFVDLAWDLTRRCGMDSMADFVEGSALDLPFQDESFDAALTFHVAMNIADRATMYREAARVLRPGAPFVAYDVLKGPEPGLIFPVPWAEAPGTSHLVTADEMVELLGAAGFSVEEVEDRTPVVLEHHRARLAETEQRDHRPPALGTHLLQGESAPEKSRNMLTMAGAGQIALGVFIARRRA